VRVPSAGSIPQVELGPRFGEGVFGQVRHFPSKEKLAVLADVHLGGVVILAHSQLNGRFEQTSDSRLLGGAEDQFHLGTKGVELAQIGFYLLLYLRGRFSLGLRQGGLAQKRQGNCREPYDQDSSDCSHLNSPFKERTDRRARGNF